jgi:hypothetical protein
MNETQWGAQHDVICRQEVVPHTSLALVVRSATPVAGVHLAATSLSALRKMNGTGHEWWWVWWMLTCLGVRPLLPLRIEWVERPLHRHRLESLAPLHSHRRAALMLPRGRRKLSPPPPCHCETTMHPRSTRATARVVISLVLKQGLMPPPGCCTPPAAPKGTLQTPLSARDL